MGLGLWRGSGKGTVNVRHYEQFAARMNALVVVHKTAVLEAGVFKACAISSVGSTH
jgi:hypothetical protein